MSKKEKLFAYYSIFVILVLANGISIKVTLAIHPEAPKNPRISKGRVGSEGRVKGEGGRVVSVVMAIESQTLGLSERRTLNLLRRQNRGVKR